jgi:hypothetical protein
MKSIVLFAGAATLQFTTTWAVVFPLYQNAVLHDGITSTP